MPKHSSRSFPLKLSAAPPGPTLRHDNYEMQAQILVPGGAGIEPLTKK